MAIKIALRQCGAVCVKAGVLVVRDVVKINEALKNIVRKG